MQTVFNNIQERNKYLATLPDSELDRLRIFYSEMPDRTRLPYCNFVLNGIVEEITRRWQNLTGYGLIETAEKPLINEIEHYPTHNQPFDFYVNRGFGSLDLCAVDVLVAENNLEAWEVAQLLGNN